MDIRGKRILEKALGTFGYRRMIKELRRNVYSESDHYDLARHLDLIPFYQEVTKLEFISFKEIPEVQNRHSIHLYTLLFIQGASAKVGRGQPHDSGQTALDRALQVSHSPLDIYFPDKLKTS